MYFAVIGDIKNSRKIDERYQLQERLEKILQEVNSEFDKYIAAKFIVTLGDEFQGLLNSTQPILRIVEKIMLEIHPVKLRFGIGVGDISTKINREMAIGADGSAYHHARRMINEIKKSQGSRNGDQASIKIWADENKNIVKLANNTFSLWYCIQEKWTQKQVRLILEIADLRNNQREVARRLGIAQSTVQRGLKSSGYYSYMHTRMVLEEVMVSEWG